jgi:hypothetical protein
MLALSFVFPDKVLKKPTEGALWHNKQSQYDPSSPLPCLQNTLAYFATDLRYNLSMFMASVSSVEVVNLFSAFNKRGSLYLLIFVHISLV